MEKKKADDNVEQNKKKSNSWAISLLIAFGVIAFYWLSYAVTSDTKIDEPMVTRNEANKSAFIGGCNSNGKMTQYCTCVWNKIDAKYTDEQIDKIGIEYSKTNQWPASFTTFINECIQANVAELESV